MHNGIELRVTLDGRPIVKAESLLLHNLLNASGGNERDLLDCINLSTVKEISIYVRPVKVDDGHQLDDDECESDEPAERPYAAGWWDRAELANWRMFPSMTPTDGVTLMHAPCGQYVHGASMLAYAVRRVVEHQCPRDKRPAPDTPAVADWIEQKNAEDACGRGPHPVALTRRG